VGTAPLARRLLAGSFDRAVDVAATLELRGYGLDAPRVRGRRLRSRYDRRFYAVASVLLAAAIVGKALGADDFNTYPSIEVGVGATTAGLALLVALSGLTPLKRRSRRVASLSRSAGQTGNSRRASHKPGVARV
ncbi:MAG TPA: hypothetical protein VJU14_00120, partial [Solirubrobacterales bacterium]|nr:hypothetical protein [Solirubrobacterales bacterium]